jgi:selenocysteine-specific elongation factor
VVIQPAGRNVRVRRLQSHGHDVDGTGAGTRAALNLADIDAVDGVHRGDVVTVAGLGRPSSVIDVLLEISSRAKRCVSDGLRVRVHYGSGNVAARVALGAGRELTVGARTIAELRLEAPAFVFAGDHFILRDWSEQQTLAGGVVLDPDANRKAFRTAKRIAWLQRVAESIEDPLRLVSAYVARAGAVPRASLLLKSHFGDEEVTAAVETIAANGALVIVGDVVVDAGAWERLGRAAADAIDAAHRGHPEHLGLSLTDLRSAIESDLPLSVLFEPLVAALCERGFVREGTVIRRGSHRATLPQPLQAAGAKLRQALAARPMDPPSRKELTPDLAAQRACRFLIETGEVVEIGGDIVMTAQAVAEATDLVRTFIRQHGPATVSDLRQVLGSSRRVVVPLLEHLDRTFVTLRQGDKRTVRR